MQTLKEEEARILATLDEGAAGLLVSRALAAAMDRFLIDAYRRACSSVGPIPFPLAIVATGGQGRFERSPRSDLDFAILHRAQKTSDRALLERVCEALLYPLWDQKIDLGHGVRTVKETIELFERDEAALTSHLDARWLDGDSQLFDELRTASVRAFKKRGAAYVEKQLEPIRERARAETLVFVLEPNLKTGPGGLRDIHQIHWVLTLTDPKALRDRERTALLAARSFYLRARAYLHMMAKRRQDQLTFEWQHELAARFGRTSEQLLGRHYKHAQAVIDIKHRLFLRLDKPRRTKKRARNDGFATFDGRLGVVDREHFEATPKDMLRVFVAAQESGMWLTDLTLDALSHAAPKIDALRGDPDMAAMFWRIVDQPRGADALVDLHQCGILERFLPEFGRTRGMVQADFYHAFTVDVHSLNVLSLLYGLRRGEGPENFATLAKNETSWRSLVMGCLFHDAGKRSGKDHAVFGAELVEKAMTRLRAPHGDVLDAALLVREHLTMPKISQQRDLSDTELIADFAKRAGSVERLQRLYVLSYVDTHGTGPTLWTPWKGALLEELYLRTRAHLLAERRSFSRFSEQEIAILREMQQHGGGVKLGPDTHGHTALYVVARDRPGLLAVVAGACAKARVSIASAEVFSSAEGFALDRFMVRYDAPRAFSPEEAAAASAKKLRELVADVSASLSGTVMQFAPPPSRTPLLDKRVRVSRGGTSALGEIIDVTAPDRPGLLHALAETLFENGYSIALARVSTEGARAVDAFYVSPSRADACSYDDLIAKLQAVVSV